MRASWSEAALVTAKTMVGMALVTAIWFGTGWRYGSVMLMSASVFLTLFSSNASARALVRQILLGSAGGALAAVLYVAILPASATPREAVVHAIPVLAVGAWAMTRPLTAKAAIDFNMVFLMAAQPAYAARGDVATTSSFGLAVVLGVLAATIFFHAAHESRRERIARLTREVVRELRRLAASGGPDVAGSRSAAMTDRVVRMAMASRVDDLIAPAVDAAVDLLGLGRAIERLVALRIADAPVVGGGDLVAAALTRIEGGLHRPLECAAGLERAADLLAGAGASPAQAPSRSAEAALSLRDAARVLRRQAPLLDIPPPPI